MKRKRSTRENGLKTSAFRSEAPNRARPITAAPASKRAHSTQLVEEAQRLEEVFVRTNPAPALSEDEIAFHEFLKHGEYLDASRKAREDVFADPRSPEAAKRARPYARKGTKTSLPSSRRLPKYRSALKRHISNILTNQPDASALQVCKHVDEQVTDDIPASWLKNNNREVAVAYLDKEVRPKIDTMISKVRRDLSS